MRVGERLGELTIEGLAPDRHTGEHQVALRCDCGRPALRTVRYLAQLPKGRTPMCVGCLQELRRGLFISAKAVRGAILAHTWIESGSLYSASWEERETLALREEVGKELEIKLDEQDEVEPHDMDVADWTGQSRAGPGHGAHVVPIAGVAGWLCDRCAKPFGEGFACLECMLVFCSGCVVQHEEGLSGGLTLEEIGILSGRSRERIRQEINKAIRKLRHPSRSIYLREFAYDDDYRIIARLPDPDPEPTSHCGRPLATGQAAYCSRCGKTFPKRIQIYADEISIEHDFEVGCITRFIDELKQRAGETRNVLMLRHGGSVNKRWRLDRAFDQSTEHRAEHTYLDKIKRLYLGALALWQHNSLLHLHVSTKTREHLQSFPGAAP